MTEVTTDSKGFRIGAVARLTGISPDALRAWERRYQVISPQRSPSGTRLYSEQDVARLRLIKRLVDAGQAIGTVATLNLAELEARGQQLESVDSALPPDQTSRLLLAGPTLPLRLAAAINAEDPALLQVVGSYQDLSDLEQTELQADVLLIECPTLDERSAQRLRRVRRLSGARRVLVIYGFAPRDALAAVEAEGFTLLRFPVGWEALRHYCLPERPAQASRIGRRIEGMDKVIDDAIPVRRFDDGQLARAGMISTTIKCECPHHLADLIIALARFERYSAECEIHNDQDADLHAYLHGTTARARALMEGALAQLLEMEGLSVGEPSP